MYFIALNMLAPLTRNSDSHERVSANSVYTKVIFVVNSANVRLMAVYEAQNWTLLSRTCLLVNALPSERV